MSIQGDIKQNLLRFGGYTLAKHIYGRIEQYQLMQRIRKFLKTGTLPLPDMMMFEVTQRCNLRCKMCFQDREILANSHDELSTEQIIDFFDHQPYLKKITLIGGEIFVRKDMLDLICHLDQTRNLVLSTNATLLDEAKIAMLKKCRNIVTICISLDGPPEIHDAIRRVPGSYDKTVRTIQALTPMFPVTVSGIISNENIEMLPEMVNKCAALGVKKLKFELERIYHEEGKSQAIAETGLQSDDLPISSAGRQREYSGEKLRSTLRECQNRGQRAGIYVMFDPFFLMENIDACYAGNLRTRKNYVCKSFRMATLAPNGDVINCFAIRKPFGNILKAPFDTIWNSEIAVTYRRELLRNNLTPLCENCPFMIAYQKNLSFT